MSLALTSHLLAGTIGIYQHAWIYGVLGIKARALFMVGMHATKQATLPALTTFWDQQFHLPTSISEFLSPSTINNLTGVQMRPLGSGKWSAFCEF